MKSLLSITVLAFVGSTLFAQAGPPPALRQDIDRRTQAVMDSVVAWRRNIHQHPELSGQEVRTSALVAERLRALGLEVRTEVGGHGVVGLLKGGKPGKVVALRADMDALPVVEPPGLPFASTVRTVYNGQDVGVMHACGHDTHVAMLLGVAQVLAGIRAQLPGSVKFLFQPAEEQTPDGGAKPMIEAGALEDPKVDAIFGLHVTPTRVGTLQYRGGPFMASADNLLIVVHGKQTHGAKPWGGVDPIVVASQIVLGLQTIISRQADLVQAPAIVTIGVMRGGVRFNIIPDSVVMEGTIRAMDETMRRDIHARIKRTAESIAQSAGATATVTIEDGYPVTVNDPTLTARMLPTLQRVAGPERVTEIPPATWSEDFSRFEEKVPGMFFNLGVTPDSIDPAKAAPNHSPLFFADEAAFPTGVRALANLAVDYLYGTKR
jgi:amidohydrolase